MQLNTLDKDNEIVKLNYQLAGEKKKIQEAIHIKGLNSSASYRSHSQETRNKYD